ncbi:hypothetical protein ACQKFS_03110 [Pseudomonas guineae]|uniref:hypothetical protein n=1 Tax=Pseudomonas guineae TaxID=425504 RepID=UPI003D023483
MKNTNSKTPRVSIKITLAEGSAINAKSKLSRNLRYELNRIAKLTAHLTADIPGQDPLLPPYQDVMCNQILSKMSYENLNRANADAAYIKAILTHWVRLDQLKGINMLAETALSRFDEMPKLEDSKASCSAPPCAPN